MSLDRDPNIFTIDTWERDFGVARGTRVAAAAGAAALGCTLYELDPGGQAAPYHLHHANEELLIVLDGTLELRTPEGTRTVERGAVVAFRPGAEGAHRVRNPGPAAARYLVVSTMRFPEVAEYPDTGAVLAMRGTGDGWAFPPGTAADYMEVVLGALRADSAESAESGGTSAG